MPFSVALVKINDELAKDLQHQRYPSDHLNRSLELRRFGRDALYDVVVNYVRNDYSFRFTDAPIQCSNLSSGLFVPWSIMGLEFGDKEAIRILVDYDPGRVRADEAARILGWLQGLLSRVPDEPDRAIGSLLAGGEVPLRASAQSTSAEVPHVRSTVEPSSAPNAIGSCTDELEAKLVALWRDCFPGQSFQLTDDFFELGGDSLKAFSLIGQCNDCFKVDLPLTVLFENPTIPQLAAAIRGELKNNGSSLVVKLRDGADKPPLVLVHPAGGALYCYRDLVCRLDGNRAVYGMRASSLNPGESLPASVEHIAEQYVRAAADTLGERRWHLAGWSFGGLIAYAMADALSRSRHPHLTLTLIDTPARPKYVGEDEDNVVLALIADALAIDRERLGLNGPLSLQIIIAAARDKLGASSLSEAQVHGMVSQVRNVRRLRLRYNAKRLNGPLTLIRATSEPVTRDQDFDWTEFVNGAINVVSVAATHSSIVRPPHVDKVAEILRSVMAHGGY